MDWRSMNFDWNRARAFLVTAEEGSLSAAARALGLAQPTLGRQVEALQDELGVVLFERIGRGLRLTPAGHELMAHVRAMGDAASRMSIAAYGQNDDMSGLVRISASDAYAGMLLPPILAEIQQREPRISIELVASNSASDLLRREADIALRNFRPKEPDLIARKIRDAKARIYGAKHYLDELGILATPGDLSRANFIGIDDTGQLMQGLNQMGLSLTQRNFPMACDSYLVMWAFVRQGMGLGLIDERMGDADTDMRRALPDFAPFTFPVWLVAHRDIYQSRRLRFVFDHLAEALR
jgi:DNA-binding transcriptional LysR family regulator